LTLEAYGLRDKLSRLNERDNFLLTEVWQKYAHVIEFLESGKCFAELTDSGSMQEELNEISRVACLTCRFSTDRPETVFDSQSNILVPPMSKEWIVETVDHVYNSDEIRKKMANAKKLYGRNVGEKIAKIFLDLMSSGDRPFRWSHEALKLWKEESSDFNYL
jgi:UDP-N-acetylglucosamine 2-epimerase (non-hydrolysing)